MNSYRRLQEIGQEILSEVRKRLRESTTNEDERFYLRRYIYSRLQLDERGQKSRIKKQLFDERPYCDKCGKKFDSMKDVNIHRTNRKRGYSKDNCVLMHRWCHQQRHRAEPIFEARPARK
ncbi:MAG: hypothetical protein QW356_05535 [Candidatus Hadarchaeales archaeon]